MTLRLTGCIIAILAVSHPASAQQCPNDTAFSSSTRTSKPSVSRVRADAFAAQIHLTDHPNCTGTLKNRVKLDPVIDWGPLVDGFHTTSGTGVAKDDLPEGDYQGFGEHHIDSALMNMTAGAIVPVCSASERNQCTSSNDQLWHEDTCWCETITPIIIDVGGDGYALTGVADSVVFDIIPGGTPERISWTSAGSDDAFVVLDRNGDGMINNGEELFGNFTPQPDSPDRNGFEALAVFDSVDEGGDADGVISDADAIFRRLQLWTDSNHDGISQRWELQSLSVVGVRKIDLRYRTSKRQDANGNVFRYRSKVEIGPQENWLYDVILVRWRDTWSTAR